MGDDGKPKPFEISMLYECVQLLQPTREMIHFAWCMGLEYHIGTSAMGINTMTIIAEACGRQVGDWFRAPPEDDYTDFLMSNSELQELASETQSRRAYRDRDKDKDTDKAPPPAAIHRHFQPVNPNAMELPEFDKIFANANDRMTEHEIDATRKRLRVKRELRNEYKYQCSQSEIQNSKFCDAMDILEKTIGRSATTRTENILGLMDLDASLYGEAEGRRLYAAGEELLEDEDDDKIIIGYHRARALQHPGIANCQLTHRDTIEHRLKCPYCRTSEENASQEGDAEDQAVVNAVQATTLSTSASHVWPDVLEMAMFYKAQTLVQWAGNLGAYIDPEGCTRLGTRPAGAFFGYKKKTNGTSGAARVDVAWLQAKGEWGKSWHRTAECFRNHGSRTISEFDVHLDGLRDLLWQCSTRDNARPLTDDPYVLSSMLPEKATKDLNDKVINEDTLCVKLAPHRIPGERQNAPLNHEHLPRDVTAGVQNTALQRRLDSFLHGGRLAALNSVISNKIIVAPPIRMNPFEGVEVNVGAIHAHTMLVAEAVLTCATVPGLRNMQEQFCNGQSGPDGLCAPVEDDGGAPGDKRPNSAGSADNGDGIHTLPYSYDVVSIAIGLDTANMLYDDMGTKWVENNNLKYGSTLGLRLAFDDLPHLSMRYIGYSQYNRQTVSLKIGAVRPVGQAYVESGDPSQEESQISRAHVQRSLARQVTDDDHAQYISRKQGAMRMGNVRGDLFASSTWFKHTISSLRGRGLITGSANEAAVIAFSNMEQCIHSRVVEHASLQGQAPYKDMKLMPASPNSYSAAEKVQPLDVDNGKKRKIVREIDELGWDPMAVVCAYDPAPQAACSAEAEAGGSDDPILLGEGPTPA